MKPSDEQVRVAAEAIAADWNQRMFEIRKKLERKLREVNPNLPDEPVEPGGTTAENWLTEARAALESVDLGDLVTAQRAAEAASRVAISEARVWERRAVRAEAHAGDLAAELVVWQRRALSAEDQVEIWRQRAVEAEVKNSE